MSAIEVPAEVTTALDDLTTAITALDKLHLERLTPPARLQVLEQLETARRLQMAVSQAVIGGLAQEDPADLGGPAYRVIADWLRNSYTDSRHRIRDAEQLSPRVTLTGQQLPPSCRPPRRRGATACSMPSTCG